MDFSSPITTALINSINNQAPATATKEVRCEICNILVSSYIVLRDHIAGRKHKNQFKFLCRKKNKIDLNCVMCNYLCKDTEDYHEHVTSENHVERVKVQVPQKSVEIPPPVQPVQHNFIQPITPSNSNSNANSIPPPLLPVEELRQIQMQLNQKALRQIVDRKEWKCINCNVICQSECSWNAHITSKKHRKNKHKFHTYPGISREFVKRKYQNSFVRARETVGNEFIEDGVVFYCKRCDVRMESKIQLEIHMTSNQHKLNHPIEPVQTYTPIESSPVTNNQQLFNFENSSYGYGARNWNAEQYIFNKNFLPPSQAEIQKQLEMEYQKRLVEEAKNNLLARFPFYAISLQSDSQLDQVPLPVPAPSFDQVPLPPE